MEKIKNTQSVNLAQTLKQEGAWLPPHKAAPYFRNGRGMKLGSLLQNLRTGKLSDIAYRDAFGWWVFIPKHLMRTYQTLQDEKTIIEEIRMERNKEFFEPDNEPEII